MKRTLSHVLIAFATFLIGTAAHRVFDGYEEASPEPQTKWVRITAHDQSDSPEPPLQTVPEVVFDFDPAEFNPRGTFYILGRKPKEFREFDCFELPVDEKGNVISEVMIQTYVDETYAANYSVSGLVTRERIYLVSEPMFEGDVGYRFEGEFLRQGVLWRAGNSRAVLKGRLSKIKDGVKIAEAVVRFRIEYPGC